MILRSPTENENANACRCIRLDLFLLRRGKPVLSEAEGIEMGVLKQNLRSPLPCLPRQGEGITSALSLSFFTSACTNNFRKREITKSSSSFLPRVAGEHEGGDIFFVTFVVDPYFFIFGCGSPR